MKGNGAMPALILILALTMACGSENQRGLKVLDDVRIEVISAYWGNYFVSTEGDKLIMTFPDDQT